MHRKYYIEYKGNEGGGEVKRGWAEDDQERDAVHGK